MLVFALLRFARLRLLLLAEGGKQVFKVEVALVKGFAAETSVAVGKAVFRLPAAEGVAVERRTLRAGELFVVGGAALGVGQGFVSEIDGHGFLGGIGLFADVGVVAAHQFAVGLFDFSGIGIGGDAEHLVMGGFGHSLLLWSVLLFFQAA